MTGLFSIVPLLVFFPLTGVVVLALFGRRMMRDKDSIAPGVLASTLSALSFFVSVLMFIGLAANGGGNIASLNTAGDPTVSNGGNLIVGILYHRPRGHHRCRPPR